MNTNLINGMKLCRTHTHTNSAHTRNGICSTSTSNSLTKCTHQTFVICVLGYDYRNIDTIYSIRYNDGEFKFELPLFFCTHIFIFKLVTRVCFVLFDFVDEWRGLTKCSRIEFDTVLSSSFAWCGYYCHLWFLQQGKQHSWERRMIFICNRTS